MNATRENELPARGRKGSQTHDRLLREALWLASKEGMAGVTLGRVAERANISKSGLFAHFDSRADILIELLDYAASIFEPVVVEPAMREPDGLPRLVALVHNWLGWSSKAGLPGGCPTAAAMFEFDDMPDPARSKVLEREASWRARLRAHAQRAVELGHLRADLDLDQFVWEITGIYLAHHVSRRFVQDPMADERARSAFRALVHRASPNVLTGA